MPLLILCGALLDLLDFTKAIAEEVQQPATSPRDCSFVTFAINAKWEDQLLVKIKINIEPKTNYTNVGLMNKVMTFRVVPKKIDESQFPDPIKVFLSGLLNLFFSFETKLLQFQRKIVTGSPIFNDLFPRFPRSLFSGTRSS